MKGNKIKLIAKTSIIFIIYSLLCASNTWSNEDTTALERYLNFQGSTYVISGVSFNEIGSTANENSQYLWPFDKDEAEQRYRDIANEIMGTLFRPAKDLSSPPLEVYLNVNLLNDRKSIAAMIRVEIVKHLPFIDRSEGDKLRFVELMPIVFWERCYLYIEADYFSDEKSAKYGFGEAIDKYFKEFLYGYIKKILHYQNMDKEEVPSLRSDLILTSIERY